MHVGEEPRDAARGTRRSEDEDRRACEVQIRFCIERSAFFEKERGCVFVKRGVFLRR